MPAASASLGFLPDADVLRPRVWIGDTATAEVQYRDDARNPVAPGAPVEFLWRSPENAATVLPGVAVPGTTGRFRCAYIPPVTGTWAVRARAGTDGPRLRWAPFTVVAEPPGNAVPAEAIWLTSPTGALVTLGGQHLAGATIAGFTARNAFVSGDQIPVVAPDGQPWRLPVSVMELAAQAAAFARVTAPPRVVSGTSGAIVAEDNGGHVFTESDAPVTLSLPHTAAPGHFTAMTPRGIGRIGLVTAAGGSFSDASTLRFSEGRHLTLTAFCVANATGTAAVWVIGGSGTDV